MICQNSINKTMERSTNITNQRSYKFISQRNKQDACPNPKEVSIVQTQIHQKIRKNVKYSSNNKEEPQVFIKQ
ncbi:hypothetical protein Ocin01_10956 [Orchesella cincta]|uniref:Uncharacterized protein n=1 Tax=Orchesella cincta TaxID=48709 RepID=A0A1D2MRK5_ORCCI|nr:hypothetical protein Ocin01_10956 [Orchesella cincta]